MRLLFLNLARSSNGIPANVWALLAPLILLELLLVVFALVDVVRRDPRQVRGNKTVWILVIILVGTIGPICYFIVGRKEA